MGVTSQTKPTAKQDILMDVLRSAGVGMQIIAAGDKMSGSKKLKTFVAIVSGDVLASLFSRFQKSVEEVNSSSAEIPQRVHKPTAPVPDPTHSFTDGL